MKTITKEIKMKIFASYIGCDIKVSEGLNRKLIAVGGYEDEPYIKLRLGQSGQGQFVHSEFIDFSKSRLLVTPLSKITEEDLNEVGGIINALTPQSFIDSLMYADKPYGLNPNRCVHAIQYLQSKGYALSYMDYSVEQLIILGVYLFNKRP